MNPNIDWRALASVLFIVLAVSSCEEVIEYSPYQNIVKSKWKKQNISNYNKLLPAANEPFEPFRIGLIADSHSYYDEFEDQVKYINTRDDLDFIVHLGDVTLSANAREYDWYSDIMNKINIPVLTLIGNHDCLGNGYDIYTEMFGESNFFFEYKDVKFVMFDDIIWEKKVQDPDFEWFDNALANDSEYKYVLPFAHIPPWDDQFSMGNEYLYNQILLKHNLDLSIHGHGHSYRYAQPYDDVNYLSIPSPERYQLIILDVQADTIKHEVIKY
ncbi:metallophosphoesterase family protein [Carboxylicivirga sp. RSCT41]|uniref:metallophosphoesterase family protein n=1 Tax=Carboxylicivirga agarovorans TaxID=3417570 RepID=UPI003D34B32A